MVLAMSLRPARTRIESPFPIRPGMPTAKMDTPSNQKLQTEMMDSSALLQVQQDASWLLRFESENDH